jgi:Flp pilus assembly protein TadG
MRARAENGQVIPEFAVVLPVLAFILFAIIQFGIVYNKYITLTDAVRAGSRAGATYRSSMTSTTDANNYTLGRVEAAASGLDMSGTPGNCGTTSSSSLIVCVSSTWQPGADLTVTATYPYSISLMGWVVKSGRLTSSITERVE